MLLNTDHDPGEVRRRILFGGGKHCHHSKTPYQTICQPVFCFPQRSRVGIECWLMGRRDARSVDHVWRSLLNLSWVYRYTNSHRSCQEFGKLRLIEILFLGYCIWSLEVWSWGGLHSIFRDDPIRPEVRGTSTCCEISRRVQSIPRPLVILERGHDGSERGSLYSTSKHLLCEFLLFLDL